MGIDWLLVVPKASTLCLAYSGFSYKLDDPIHHEKWTLLRISPEITCLPPLVLRLKIWPLHPYRPELITAAKLTDQFSDQSYENKASSTIVRVVPAAPGALAQRAPNQM